MLYCGTGVTETIAFQPIGEPNNIHYLELTKLSDAPVFVVSFCCDEEWKYSFVLDGNLIYEQVKSLIMDTIFSCDTIDELLEELGDIFEDEFGENLLQMNHCSECDGCDDCDGNCGNCNNTYMN